MQRPDSDVRAHFTLGDALDGDVAVRRANLRDPYCDEGAGEGNAARENDGAESTAFHDA
jgi:hypothetical protein